MVRHPRDVFDGNQVGGRAAVASLHTLIVRLQMQLCMVKLKRARTVLETPKRALTQRFDITEWRALMESTDYLSRYEEDENGCWNYQGSINPAGYGQIRQTTAHRFFWTHIRGDIPDGLQLDHLCLNKRCVNPSHLEPVTNAENQRRRSELITVCKHGHDFTPENTVVKRAKNGDIKRNCRTCNKALSRAHRERKKGAPLGPVGRPRKKAA